MQHGKNQPIALTDYMAHGFHLREAVPFNEERFIQNAARLTHLARTLIYARSILDKMSLNGAAWGGLSLWSLNGVFAAWGRRKDWA